MPFSSNILKEFMKQMVLELWENKEVLTRGWQGFTKNKPGQAPSPFLFQKLAMFQYLRHGCLNVREP